MLFLHRPLNSSDSYEDLHTILRASSLLLPTAANLPQMLSKYHSVTMGLDRILGGEQACYLQFVSSYYCMVLCLEHFFGISLVQYLKRLHSSFLSFRMLGVWVCDPSLKFASFSSLNLKKTNRNINIVDFTPLRIENHVSAVSTRTLHASTSALLQPLPGDRAELMNLEEIALEQRARYAIFAHTAQNFL